MLAPDVLGRKGSIMEQISTLKISNFSVGKNIVGMLGSSAAEANKDAPEVDPRNRISFVRYCVDSSIVITVTPSCVRFWRFSNEQDFTAPMLMYSTQLLKDNAADGQGRDNRSDSCSEDASVWELKDVMTLEKAREGAPRFAALFKSRRSSRGFRLLAVEADPACAHAAGVSSGGGGGAGNNAAVEYTTEKGCSTTTAQAGIPSGDRRQIDCDGGSSGSTRGVCRNADRLHAAAGSRVLTTHSDGIVRVFSVSMGSRSLALTLMPLMRIHTELCDSPYGVVLDCSGALLGHRWLAVQCTRHGGQQSPTHTRIELAKPTQASDNGNPHSNSNSDSDFEWVTHKNAVSVVDASGSVVGSSGDVVRMAVTGMYHAGKLGWDAMAPYLNGSREQGGGNGLANGGGGGLNGLSNGNSSGNGSGGNNFTSEGGVIGGCIEVFDLESSSTSSAATVVTFAKFIAHHNSISTMRISSGGLRIASSDVYGQVIHVHSLCKASSRWCNTDASTTTSVVNGSGCVGGSSTAERSSGGAGGVRHGAHNRFIQLLFKLHRGMTLVTIIDLKFDDADDVLVASTANGTQHVFALPNAAINNNYTSSIAASSSSNSSSSGSGGSGAARVPHTGGSVALNKQSQHPPQNQIPPMPAIEPPSSGADSLLPPLPPPAPTSVPAAAPAPEAAPVAESFESDSSMPTTSKKSKKKAKQAAAAAAAAAALAAYSSDGAGDALSSTSSDDGGHAVSLGTAHSSTSTQGTESSPAPQVASSSLPGGAASNAALRRPPSPALSTSSTGSNNNSNSNSNSNSDGSYVVPPSLVDVRMLVASQQAAASRGGGGNSGGGGGGGSSTGGSGTSGPNTLMGGISKAFQHGASALASAVNGSSGSGRSGTGGSGGGVVNSGGRASGSSGNSLGMIVGVNSSVEPEHVTCTCRFRIVERYVPHGQGQGQGQGSGQPGQELSNGSNGSISAGVSPAGAPIAVTPPFAITTIHGLPHTSAGSSFSPSAGGGGGIGSSPSGSASQGSAHSPVSYRSSKRYAMVVVTSDGYISRYECSTLRGAIGGGTAAGGGAGGTSGNAGNEGPGNSSPSSSQGGSGTGTGGPLTVGSFPSSYGSVGTSSSMTYGSQGSQAASAAAAAAALTQFSTVRETHRWDVQTNKSPSFPSFGSAVTSKGPPSALPASAPHPQPHPAQLKHVHNSDAIRRIIWLSNATTYDATRNRYQTDLDISGAYCITDQNMLLPLWRRPKVTFSVMSPTPGRATAGAGPGSGATLEDAALPYLFRSECPRSSLQAYHKAARQQLRAGEGGGDGAGASSGADDCMHTHELSHYIASVLYQSTLVHGTGGEGEAGSGDGGSASASAFDAELAESVREFKRKQDELKLHRRQQQIANRIEVVPMDGSGCGAGADGSEGGDDDDCWMGLEAPNSP